MSDILPGCFGLGGCQPQFCTSLQAQFDVVWITFRHTHTPSLAFIQGSSAGHPLCSEGGIWQGPNTPGKKSPSFSSPSCLSHAHTKKTPIFVLSKIYVIPADYLTLGDHSFLHIILQCKQQMHPNAVKLHLNDKQNAIHIKVSDVLQWGKNRKAAIRPLIKLKNMKAQENSPFSDPQKSGMLQLLPLRHRSISHSLEQQWLCDWGLARGRQELSRSESVAWCVCSWVSISLFLWAFSICA